MESGAESYITSPYSKIAQIMPVYIVTKAERGRIFLNFFNMNRRLEAFFY